MFNGRLFGLKKLFYWCFTSIKSHSRALLCIRQQGEALEIRQTYATKKIRTMATIKSFEELDSWKFARELCEKVGKIIDDGRMKRKYRLIDQMEGSSGSIMDNIAEGFER